MRPIEPNIFQTFSDPSFGDVSGLPDPYGVGQQQGEGANAQLAAAQQQLMSMGQQQQQVRIVRESESGGLIQSGSQITFLY